MSTRNRSLLNTQTAQFRNKQKLSTFLKRKKGRIAGIKIIVEKPGLLPGFSFSKRTLVLQIVSFNLQSILNG